MTTRPDIQPKKPKKCPVCGENAVEAMLSDGFDIYGPPHDFILELKGMDAEMILLRGWICSLGRKTGVFGTVLAYRLNGKREEFISPDHCYMIFEGDKFSVS